MTANDVFGRVATVDDSQSGRTAYSYYADGQLHSVTVFSLAPTGGEGGSEGVEPYRETGYVYDALGRLVSIVDSVAGTTSFTFDHRGRRTSLTDSVESTTSWAYNQLDQVVTETDPLAAERSFIYDKAGNLVRAVDRLGRTIDYTYDEAGRRTKEIWYREGEAPAEPTALGGDDENALRTFTYEYDAAGRLESASDSGAGAETGDSTGLANFYTFQYHDGLDRVKQSHFVTDGLSPAFTLEYEYDRNGNRTELRARAIAP